MTKITYAELAQAERECQLISNSRPEKWEGLDELIEIPPELAVAWCKAVRAKDELAAELEIFLKKYPA